MRARSWNVLVPLIVVLIWVAPAWSQTPPEFAQGANPAATYFTTNFDNVDMSTGRLLMQIPLLVDKSQRGRLNFSYSLTYSMPEWVPYTDSEGDVWWALSQSGFNLGPYPALDGALGTTGWNGSFIGTSEANGADHPDVWLGDHFESVDGSGIRASYPSPPSPFTAINKDGIRFVSGGNPSYIEDANGNVMTSSTSNLVWSSLFQMSSWTMYDTVGRAWSLAATDTGSCPGGASSATVWTVPGFNNINRPFTFCYSTVSISNTYCPYNPPDAPPVPCYPYSYNDTPLTAVILPDGTSWQFQYNNGVISKVILPTGGTISYTQATDPTYGNLYMQTRTVCDNVNPCQTWTYDFSQTVSGTAKVTDPLANDTVYSSLNSGGPGTVGEIQYFQGPASNGNQLKQVNKSYQAWVAAGFQTSLPTGETTILANGQQSQWSQTWDSGFSYLGSNFPYGLVMQVQHYDWNNGAPNVVLSQTSNSYVAFNNSSYLSANLLSLVAQQSVSGSGGNGSTTTFNYDQNIVGTNFATQHWSAPNPGVLGNLTSVVQWNSSTNSNLTTQTLYIYDTGMPYYTLDAKGNHSATYTYEGTGTYPITACNAKMSQCTTFAYDMNSGLATSVTDANGLTTTYSYNDPFLRLYHILNPDGGQITFFYSPNSVQETQTLTNSLSKITTQNFDGMGLLIQTQLNSDPEGTVSTDTVNDPLGRVASVSNPYRNTSESTYGLTKYAYDALGRVIQVTPPDSNGSSNYVTTLYSGNSTTVTDQVGNQRRSYADGLGRLTEMDEPSTNAATSGSGSFSVSGSEQVHNGGTAGRRTFTISAPYGGEQSRDFPAAGTGYVIISGSIDYFQSCGPWYQDQGGDWTQDCVLHS